MNGLVSQNNRFLTPYRLFQLFKYTVYLLLAWNVYLWFQEDLAAAAETMHGQLGWGNFVEAYTATIDTLMRPDPNLPSDYLVTFDVSEGPRHALVGLVHRLVDNGPVPGHQPILLLPDVDGS